MLILVTGGSGSGKSAFAEQLAVRFAGQICRERGGLYYLATMTARDGESLARIARHRAQRAGYGFRTVECGPDFFLSCAAGEDAVLAPAPVGTSETGQAVFGEQSVVMLEDLSNLLAGCLYPEPLWKAGEDACRMPEILGGLAAAAGCMVIVTNEIFSEPMAWGEETLNYIRLLGAWNARLAAAADGVAEVVCGIPVWHKARGTLGILKNSREREPEQGKPVRKGARMENGKTILVIGGAYQGKGAYVRAHFPQGYEVVSGYHEQIRRQLLEGRDCEREAEALLQKKGGLVIISDEIGGGLVPMNPFERAYRETVGRIHCMLAGEADSVIRVVCGIGEVLKGYL